METVHAARLIRLAREDVDLSQAELATAAGVQQPTISAYESGAKRPRPETLTKILRAARMRPSIALFVQAEEIRRSAAVHGLADVRVFGSVLTGADDERSDIDLLVRTKLETTLFDLGAFSADVTALTGFPVDIVTEFQAEARAFRHVRDEAQPL